MDLMDHEDEYFDQFGLGPLDEVEEDVEPVNPPWRRPLLIGIAAITAATMLLIPLYNVLRGQQIADNGLEVCGFDYCDVQDVVVAAGLNEEMSRLANTFLDDEEAMTLATALLHRVGESDVSFRVVDRLDGEIKGQFDPGTKTISVERPVRAWIVVHEVAHTRAGGHDEDFQSVLIDLTQWIANSRA